MSRPPRRRLRGTGHLHRQEPRPARPAAPPDLPRRHRPVHHPGRVPPVHQRAHLAVEALTGTPWTRRATMISTRIRTPIGLTLGLLFVDQSAPAAGWKAGTAKVAITPTKSTWMAGYGARD